MQIKKTVIHQGKEEAIDGWSIAYAALFPSKKTKQLTSFLIKYTI